ncbi:MAG: hypothetical protein JJ850_05270 [Kordiimonadaceae bacterium]|nr:hypothetical protein [Kordiimonadaceae bacterium]MBO6568268.1 hypothetical protein [Kordiimonadaceae bacterium]MBO6964002.1 hypothetical protein [Kordiimonadaceae bacterium]
MGFFEGGDGDDLVTGGDGDDTIRGYRGWDTLEGGFGDDTLIGGRGNDSIDGGCGDDYIRIDRGDDTIDGGLGFDIIDYSWWVITSPAGLLINLDAGVALDFEDGEDIISNIEHVIGPEGDDTIIGSDDDESLEGNGGDDILIGGGGTNTLEGGSGADTFRYDGFEDDIIADFNSNEGDVIDLREVAEIESFAEIQAIATQVGDDLVLTFAQGATITLWDTAIADLDANDFLFAGVDDADTVRGSDASNDHIGSSGAEHFRVGAGDDKVFGRGGNDITHGGRGSDTIGGGSGNDTIFGGNGNDLIFGGKGSGDNDDVLDGEGGNDTLHGGSGSDTAVGGDGRDVLFGGTGDDDLSGGSGNDSLYGGTGDDVMAGGVGDDAFYFGGNHGDDVITDFDAGDDVLFLRNADAGFADLAAVQAAATETTIDGVAGLLIDTGGGNGIFIEGATLADLTASSVAL